MVIAISVEVIQLDAFMVKHSSGMELLSVKESHSPMEEMRKKKV